MKRFQIWVDDDKYEELKEIADKKGMAVSEYCRNILNKTSTVELTINFADIDKYVEEIEDLKKKIDSVLPTIYRTGKIYEPQAILLKQTLNHINSKCNSIWRYVTQTRTQMYDEVRSKLYTSVKANGYKRRKTKRSETEVKSWQ